MTSFFVFFEACDWSLGLESEADGVALDVEDMIADVVEWGVVVIDANEVRG